MQGCFVALCFGYNRNYKKIKLFAGPDFLLVETGSILLSSTEACQVAPSTSPSRFVAQLYIYY